MYIQRVIETCTENEVAVDTDRHDAGLRLRQMEGSFVSYGLGSQQQVGSVVEQAKL